MSIDKDLSIRQLFLIIVIIQWVAVSLAIPLFFYLPCRIHALCNQRKQRRLAREAAILNGEDRDDGIPAMMSSGGGGGGGRNKMIAMSIVKKTSGTPTRGKRGGVLDDDMIHASLLDDDSNGNGRDIEDSLMISSPSSVGLPSRSRADIERAASSQSCWLTRRCFTIQLMIIICIALPTLFIGLSGLSYIPWTLGGAILAVLWLVAWCALFTKVLLPTTTSDPFEPPSLLKKSDSRARTLSESSGIPGMMSHSNSSSGRDRSDTSCLSSLQRSIKRSPTGFIAGCVPIIAIAFVYNWAIADMCVALHPFSMSTRASRHWAGPSCHADKICHTFLTAANDMSTQVIVNFHVGGTTKPVNPYVQVWQHNITDAYVSDATCFDMHAVIDEEPRWVCWSDVINRTPATVYTVLASVAASDAARSQTRFNGEQLRWRTSPAADSNEAITWISGGDYVTGHDELGYKLALAGISKMTAADSHATPVAGMIGGDLDYSNALPSCYRRTDAWITEITAALRTPANRVDLPGGGGLSLPIITTIGNHESGGYFDVARHLIPFYIRYFPHAIGLQSVGANERDVYHSHHLGSGHMMLALDSGIVDGDEITATNKQTVFMRDTLITSATTFPRSARVAAYHYSLFPSKGIVMPNWVDAARTIWLPLFDRYNVSLAFEHHYHVLKVTHPYRNGKMQGFVHKQASPMARKTTYQPTAALVATTATDDVATDGVTFVGDGSWGVLGEMGMEWSPWLRTLSGQTHVWTVIAVHGHMNASAWDDDGNMVAFVTKRW